MSSPDGSITATIDVSSGVPFYESAYDGTTYVEQSPLGFDFADQSAFGTAVFGSGPNVTVTGSERETTTETWEPEWGNYDAVSEDYRSLRLGLAETSGPERTANLELRVFDDGLGFRLVLGDAFGSFRITSENTEFNFAGDYTAWWIRNDFTDPRFEREYTESPLSDIPAGSRQIPPNDNAVRPTRR